MCMRVRVLVRVCIRVCVHACVHVCVCVRVRVHVSIVCTPAREVESPIELVGDNLDYTSVGSILTREGRAQRAHLWR